MKKYKYYRMDSEYPISNNLLEVWGKNGWELCTSTKIQSEIRIFGFQIRKSRYDNIFKHEII